jgi:hypothetical protein
MSSPIIYYHEGYDSFVPIVLKHNSKYIDAKDHLMLTDVKYKGINCIDISEYESGQYLADFNKHYVKLSNTSDHYNHVIFKRWYVIYEYMTRENIDSIWYLDSDVLIYRDLNELKAELSGYESALIAKEGNFIHSSIIDYYKDVSESSSNKRLDIISGHTSYFSKEGLESLLLSGIDMFGSSKEICKKYYNQFFVETGKDGGVDDMHLVTHYYMQYKANVYNLSLHDSHFDTQAKRLSDHNGNYASERMHGFELKKMVNHNLLLNDEKISVSSLHFQHLSKYCMHKYLNYRLDPFTYLHQVSILYFRRAKTFLSKQKKTLLNV